jgi:zinc protease
MFPRALRSACLAICVAVIALMTAAPAQAAKIERVVSPSGIEAWLVRETSVPLVAIEFALRGGADQDPVDKPGVANMAVSLLDEGAGDLNASEFQERLERKAIELRVRVGRDSVRGTLRALTAHLDEAGGYLNLALTAPRFDAPAVERVRAQILSALRRDMTSPNSLAARSWWEAAFAGHPYSRPVAGTLESVPRIGVEDLTAYSKRVLARETLKIGIVGDIDAERAALLIDRIFGALPAKAELTPVVAAVPQGLGQRLSVPLDVPQAVVTFGGPGIARSDPDFMAAYLVNHILGGGSFSSRLYREVRERRGLAYSVYNSLVWLNHSAITYGSTATQANRTAQTIEIIESEIRRLAADGPTEDELDKAKTYLKGSFVLGLDTSSKIASQLINMQLDNLGIDYIERRPALIDAVTLDDAKRVAKRLLDAGLLVTVVGRPQRANVKDGG